jgi:hypothetical protein
MSIPPMNSLRPLLDFLNRLDANKISHHIEHNREESIMVLIAVPGERWEVEFFEDGTIELEIFGSSSSVVTSKLDDLLHRLAPHFS